MSCVLYVIAPLQLRTDRGDTPWHHAIRHCPDMLTSMLAREPVADVTNVRSMFCGLYYAACRTTHTYGWCAAVYHSPAPVPVAD